MKRSLAPILVASIPLIGLNSADLKPISPEDHFGYASVVRFCLLGPIGERPLYWMICRPSFRREYSVSINRDGDNFYVESATAKEQIWHYKDAEAGDLTLDLRANVEVDRRKRAISENLWRRIDDLWTKAIRRTHYPKTEEMGFDGETYEFFAGPDYFGEAWSPGSGVSGAMAHLGDSLAGFATDSNVTEASLDEALLRLEKELKGP